MGVLDFLKPKPKKALTELPLPPPPPSKGLHLDIPEPLAPPIQDIPAAPAAIPSPSIPAVSAQPEPAILIPETHEEEHPAEPPTLADLPELEEAVVIEPTVSPPQRVVSQQAIKPMFISVEDYQEILNSINVIKDALRDTEESMNRLNELKNTQEKILEDWRGHLEDAERKVTYVDQVIFRGE